MKKLLRFPEIELGPPRRMRFDGRTVLHSDVEQEGWRGHGERAYAIGEGELRGLLLSA